MGSAEVATSGWASTGKRAAASRVNTSQAATPSWSMID